MNRWLRLLLLFAALAATALLVRRDLHGVGTTVAAAGWALVPVIALRLPQTLVSAWSWRALMDRRRAPGLLRLSGLRWVRDSVNTLLPVAQVGGDVVRVRLLARADGAPLADAAAGAVVDVTLETAAQLAFTAVAALLLAFGRSGTHDALPLAAVAVGGCAVIAAVMFGAQRLGLLRLLERFAGGAWRTAGDLSGLHDAVMALYARTRRVRAAAAGHLVSWAIGAVETGTALWAIGVPAGPAEAVVIEALSHIARAAGVVVPGAVGVQEGGYVVICGLYGIPPVDALALSVVRRVREVALGLPGLALWAWWERRPDRHDRLVMPASSAGQPHRASRSDETG